MAKKRGGRKYGRKASEKVEKVMRERKRGTLRSGGSGKKVTSRKQAIAIGLSEARRAGAKVPRKRKGGSKKVGRPVSPQPSAKADELPGLPFSHIGTREAECPANSSKPNGTQQDC